MFVFVFVFALIQRVMHRGGEHNNRGRHGVSWLGIDQADISERERTYDAF